MSDTRLVLHYHLPKTGGQTVRSSFAQHLEPGRELLHLGGWARREGYEPSSNEAIARCPDDQRRRVRVIVGHGVDQETVGLFEDRELWEFTVLRDPASRIVSQHNFRRHRRPVRLGLPAEDFDEWYASLPPNPMLRYLCGKFGIEKSLSALLDRLSQLAFVGETDEMDTWLPLLFKTLQLPSAPSSRANVTGADHPLILRLDPPLRDRIERDHPLDVELFRLARRDLFPGAMSRLRTEGQAVAGVSPSDGHAVAVDT